MKERNRTTSFSDLVSCSANEKVGKHKRHGRNRSARQRTVSCSSFGAEDERRRPDQRSHTNLVKEKKILGLVLWRGGVLLLGNRMEEQRKHNTTLMGKFLWKLSHVQAC